MNKKKISIAICDNDKMDTANIMKLCNAYGESRNYFIVEIVMFSDGLELIKHVKYEDGKSDGIKKFDLILLDIEMIPGVSGIYVKEWLENHRINSLIIYITNHLELAPETHGRNVCGFISKPIDKEKMFDKLDRVIGLLNDEDQIMYLKSEESYVRYYYVNGKKEIRAGVLKEEMASLNPKIFVQCHRSYIVNLQHVVKIHNGNSFIMENGDVIPISRRLLKETKIKYTNYIQTSFRSRMRV